MAASGSVPKELGGHDELARKDKGQCDAARGSTRDIKSFASTLPLILTIQPSSYTEAHPRDCQLTSKLTSATPINTYQTTNWPNFQYQPLANKQYSFSPKADKELYADVDYPICQLYPYQQLEI